MARQSNPYWAHFFTDNTKYLNDESHKKAWCHACLTAWIEKEQMRDRHHLEGQALRTVEELEGQALLAVSCMSGKSVKMERHVKLCPALSEDERRSILQACQVPQPIQPMVAGGSTANTTLILAQASVTPLCTLGTPQTLPNPHISPSLRRTQSLPSTNSLQPEETLQEAFEADICRLLIALNLSWSASSNPCFRDFIHKWVSHPIAVPDRRTLSGRVLNAEVKKVEDEVVAKVQGKLAMGQCDGWKNIAKASLVSSAITVQNKPYLITTHDVTGEPKTGDNLLAHVLADIQLIEKKYGAKVIGWVTDDGPDGKKMRRLLLESFPAFLVLVCWAHQIQLTVGDTLAIRPTISKRIAEALEVVKWFNNHSVALALLQGEQKATYAGKFWTLISPAATRWASHYLCLARFLKLKEAIRTCWTRHESRLLICAGQKAEQKAKAIQIQKTIHDLAFWEDIQMIKEVLEPLAISSNVSQSSRTRLDHVLLTLGNLFQTYQYHDNLPWDLCTGIVKSLEKRWAKADQNIFITAVFLNPYIRTTLFSKVNMTEATLYEIVAQVFVRIFQQPTDYQFFIAFNEYCHSQEEFRPDHMLLQMFRDAQEHEGVPLDLLAIWSRLDNGQLTGKNRLVRLAIHIFSVVATSADCERVFSAFGIAHTKLRNKLTSDKVHKMTVIKMGLREHQQAASNAKPRKKRKLGDPESSKASGDTPKVDVEASIDTLEEDDTDFQVLASQLVRNAQESDEPEPPEEQPPSATQSMSTPSQTHPPITQVTPFEASTRPPSTRKKTQIPLQDLFDYGKKNALCFYLKDGERNLETEEKVLEGLLSIEETEELQEGA